MSEADPSQAPSDQGRTIIITVLYFAAASTVTGLASESIDLSLPSSDASESKGFPLSALSDFLAKRHAHTNLGKVLATSQWSVDAEMVDDPESVRLKGGEEVAVICPVSGG